MHVQIPLAEKVIRTVVVYGVLVLILRAFGKRDLAQLNTLDLVVMLLLSNVVQNAIIGPDNSVLGGLIGALVLVGANNGLARLIRRDGRAARLLEGRSTVIIRDGRWVEEGLRTAALRKPDVEAALRRQGADSVSEIETLSIEPGGSIVASLKPEEQGATKADVARLEQKLDALLRDA